MQTSSDLVWQLGVLLYRVGFNDSHPFLASLKTTTVAEKFEVNDEEAVLKAGLVT